MLGFFASLLALACEQNGKKPVVVTRERSQAVESKGAETPSAARALAIPADAPSAAKPPRKLCEGELLKPARAMPKSRVSRAQAPGVSELPASMTMAGGSWTWVNFWAAWCVPCKEEIPMLKSWEAKLNSSGKSLRLVFVSLDDDPRQLQDFMQAEPPNGLRATYWLSEGKERADWLKAIDLPQDLGLPAHILVDPKGKARCIVNGAIEDSDFAQISAIVAR